MWKFIKSLFESSYTEYEFYGIKDIDHEIIEYHSLDPLDMEHTGKYKTVSYDIYVRYHKKTKLPQYKRVKRP